MATAAEHLRALRRQLDATLDASARQVVEPSLVLLTDVVGGQAAADVAELFDQLDELLEALMFERGWTEPTGAGP